MRHAVATVEEIPPGARKIVEVAGRSIGVFNLGGEFFAIRNRCPHQGGPLCEGRLWSALTAPKPGELHTSRPGEIIACVWHGWEFDIRTGQSWCAPEKLRVRRYAVDVVDPDDSPVSGYVKGPYQAETYPAEAEGGYVVVDLG